MKPRQFNKKERNRLHALFYTKNGKLYNKVNRGKRAKKDAEAGCINGAGYRHVKFDNNPVPVLVHRLIYIMEYDTNIKHEIDHINRNRLDNRLQNLRDISHSDNMLNSSRVSQKKN